MKRKLALCAAFFLALCPLAQAETATASAAPATQNASQKPEDGIQTYFRHPDSQRALQLLLHMAGEPVFQNKASARFLTMAWGAQILRDNPQESMKWCEALQSKIDAADLLVLYRFAATPDSEKCIGKINPPQELVKQAEGLNLEEFTSLTFPDAVSLDVLWVSFYATGKAEYVKKVVDFVIASKDSRDPLTTGAAKWSLGSNMMQFPEIKSMVEDYLKTLPAEKQTVFTQQMADFQK
ncbi:hypothetical protein [Cardiobacterium hominis]|jgi:hypothetical protein|uniref:hypothetical protein n=1 Tax=Cardiobacterium hominis TaxID=2718 RepID=UPI0028D00CB4|nr:hypothetical protein [Cardiobacterium hominis]